MINPPATPPARKTSHGATMSPRLSRLYTWLQANKVQLTDFSTDNCVERELARLTTLATELDALRAASPLKYLDDLAADLACLMRRRPSARVKSLTPHRFT